MTKKQLMLMVTAFFCDQVSKIVISSYLKYNESIIIIKNFFNLVLDNYTKKVYNNGRAAGI